MKKLLIVFAAGVLLASCSSTEDKAAAAGFCECYSMQADAAESSSLTEMMEAAEKMTTCVTAWQEKFKGKISKDGFADELKAACPDAHSAAEEMGVFK